MKGEERQTARLVDAEGEVTCAACCHLSGLNDEWKDITRTILLTGLILI